MSVAVDMSRLIGDIREATDFRLRAVADVRAAAHAAVAAFGAERRRMSREQRAALGRHRAHLEAAGNEMRKAARKERAATRRRLDALGQEVAHMRSAAAAQISGLAKARRGAAARQRSTLAEAVDTLQSDVREIIEDARKYQSAVRVDLQKAHTLWSDFASGAEPVAPKRPAARAAAAKAAPPPAKPAAEPGADDLTHIEGVGPVMQARLAKAGITTFAQLAEANADSLREQLGDVGRLADVGSWIAHARRVVASD
jgi:predicted flap endonuclease-1-like 5' DNA nuclease